MSDGGPANAGAKQGGRDGKGRFRPGISGNPSGTPAGSRNRASRLLDQMFEDEVEAVARAVLTAALDGDVQAQKIVVANLAPPRRERPLCGVELPPLRSVADAPGFLGSLVGAVGRGELAPGEAASLAGLVERYINAVETTDIEQRLRALEQARAGDGKGDDAGEAGGA